jgi:hypothetical protein
MMVFNFLPVLSYAVLGWFGLMILARLSRNSILVMIALLVNRVLGWLTFPGVILHEATKKIFCDLAGVPVHEAKYVSLGDPMGYVLHEDTGRFRDTYLITVGPIVVNSAFAAAMFVLTCFDLPWIADIAFLWLGFSFAMRALPSPGEMQSLRRLADRRAEKDPIVLLACPPIIMSSLVAPLKSVLRMDVIYMAALYSVTFCLVASLLIVGSAVLPGAYTARLAFADVSQADDGLYNLPSADLSSTRTQGNSATRSYDDTPGKEGSAKDYFSIADAAMKEKCSDARLIYIQGNGNGKGTSLPANGKSHLWWYQYSSPGQGKTYDVRVHDGYCYPIVENQLKDWATFDDWSLDSTEAAGIASERYEAMNGNAPSSGGTYVLTVAKAGKNKGSLQWLVSYPDPDKKYHSINVDDRTGTVV